MFINDYWNYGVLIEEDETANLQLWELHECPRYKLLWYHETHIDILPYEDKQTALIGYETAQRIVSRETNYEETMNNK